MPVPRPGTPLVVGFSWGASGKVLVEYYAVVFSDMGFLERGPAGDLAIEQHGISQIDGLRQGLNLVLGTYLVICRPFLEYFEDNLLCKFVVHLVSSHALCVAPIVFNCNPSYIIHGGKVSCVFACSVLRLRQ